MANNTSKSFKNNWAEKHKGLTVIIAVAVLFVVIGIVNVMANGYQSVSQQLAPKSTTASNNSPQSPQPALVVPKYSIVHEVTTKRYDGAVVYYLLIEPVDTNTASFKDTVKAVIKDMVAKKGNKLSLELHDSQASLDVSYKQYGDMSLGRPRNDAENKEEERHFVAAFDGELQTNLYLNQLDFFPAATEQSPVTGQYVGSEEFRP